MPTQNPLFFLSSHPFHTRRRAPRESNPLRSRFYLICLQDRAGDVCCHSHVPLFPPTMRLKQHAATRVRTPLSFKTHLSLLSTISPLFQPGLVRRPRDVRSKIPHVHSSYEASFQDQKLLLLVPGPTEVPTHGPPLNYPRHSTSETALPSSSFSPLSPIVLTPPGGSGRSRVR
jgi:hypothetical protein